MLVLDRKPDMDCLPDDAGLPHVHPVQVHRPLVVELSGHPYGPPAPPVAVEPPQSVAVVVSAVAVASGDPLYEDQGPVDKLQLLGEGLDRTFEEYGAVSLLPGHAGVGPSVDGVPVAFHLLMDTIPATGSFQTNTLNGKRDTYVLKLSCLHYIVIHILDVMVYIERQESILLNSPAPRLPHKRCTPWPRSTPDGWNHSSSAY